MNQKILDMIKEYEEEKDFYGNIKEEDVKKIELELNIILPNQYRQFILQYGSGGICGVDVEGIEGEQGSSMLQSTNRYRELGLDENIIVVYDVGEYIMCMDTTDIGDDSKVYSWQRTDKNLNERYNSFDSFLEDYFLEAIDNY